MTKRPATHGFQARRSRHERITPYVLLCSCVAGGASAAPPATPEALFVTEQIWNVRLTVARTDWRRMEPTRPSGPGSPGQRRPGPPQLDFTYVAGDLDFDGQKLPHISVRYKGNNTFMESSGSLRRSLKVDIDRDVPGRLFAGVTKLNFHSNVADPGWMNEALSFRLYRDAGVPAPRTAYARLRLGVPGLYDRRDLGLFCIVENVDRTFLRRHFGSDSGALLKPETPTLFEDQGDLWEAYERAYVPKTPVDAASAQRVMDLSHLVSRAGDREFQAQIGTFIDLDAFARYMAVTVWLSTMDSVLGLGHNYYVYLDPRTHRFHFLPWDLDRSFGQFTMAASHAELERLDIFHPWQGDKRFLERVFALEAFRTPYVAHLTALRKTLATPERLEGQVSDLAARLRPTVRRGTPERLAKFDAAVVDRADAPRSDSPPEAARALRPWAAFGPGFQRGSPWDGVPPGTAAVSRNAPSPGTTAAGSALRQRSQSHPRLRPRPRAFGGGAARRGDARHVAR